MPKRRKEDKMTIRDEHNKWVQLTDEQVKLCEKLIDAAKEAAVELPDGYSQELCITNEGIVSHSDILGSNSFAKWHDYSDIAFYAMAHAAEYYEDAEDSKTVGYYTCSLQYEDENGYKTGLDVSDLVGGVNWLQVVIDNATGDKCDNVWREW